MELFDPKKLHIPFVNSFKFFVPLSLGLFFVCLFIVFVKPGIRYGVDFRGGVETTVSFKNAAVTSAQLREALGSRIDGLTLVEAQGSKESGYAKDFLITGSDKKENVEKALDEGLEKFGKKNEEWAITKLDSVGPKVGSELKKSALLSVLYTALLVSLYIYLRFDMRYSPGAMVGALHDVMFTCGFLVLVGTEFSTNVVAALLTLAGYSINDTIIVFDRIREVEHTMLGKTKEAVIDYSINSTLSRTLITAGCTLLSLIVLWLVGGPTLRDFALTLFFGVIVGTYSSIYVAAPLYLWGDKLLSKTPTKNAPTKGTKFKEAHS